MKTLAVITGSSEKEIQKLLALSYTKVDGIELRIDRMRSLDTDLINSLIKNYSKEIVITGSNGWVPNRPCYLDVPFEKLMIPGVFHKQPGVKIILSYHNYEKTPNLEKVFEEMKKIPADVYKIATMATTISDSHYVLNFVQNHAKKHPLIGLCMGKMGFITRRLGLLYGNFFNYVLLREKDRTALGQYLID